MNNFIIYKSIENFYSLPKEIQNCKQSTFKTKLKKYMMSNDLVTFDSHD